MIRTSLKKRRGSDLLPPVKAHFLCALPSSEAFIQWYRTHPFPRALCLCGRSNVGKSSLLNALFGPRVAKTSKRSGKTREIVVFSLVMGEKGGPPLYLFDLPGFGHAEVSGHLRRQWEGLMNSFFRALGQKLTVLHIQDARHPSTEKDGEFERFLAALAPGAQRIVLVNKVDKLSHSSLLKLKEALPSGTRFLSARSKRGIGEFRVFLAHEFGTQKI